MSIRKQVRNHDRYVRHSIGICYHCVCGVSTGVLENTGQEYKENVTAL